jgi:hypothetical protein
MPTVEELEALVTVLSVDAKTKRDAGDEKLSKKPRTSDGDDDDNDDEQRDEEDGVGGEDDEEEDAGADDDNRDEAETNLDNLHVLFNAYAAEPAQYRKLVESRAAAVFAAYTAKPPGAKIRFTTYVSSPAGAAKRYTVKFLFSKLMFDLRKIVDRKDGVVSDKWSLVFVISKQKGDIRLLAEPRQPLLSAADRLTAEPDQVLLFSTLDLVCLSVALNNQRETLARVSGRKTGDKSKPVVERLVAELERIAKATKDALRALDGTYGALRATSFMLRGEPLALAVGLYEGALRMSSATDSAPVAVYFDFQRALLSTIRADDVDVPSARQLDEAYVAMLTHADRVVLLDMRDEYKRRRNWQTPSPSSSSTSSTSLSQAQAKQRQ